MEIIQWDFPVSLFPKRNTKGGLYPAKHRYSFFLISPDFSSSIFPIFCLFVWGFVCWGGGECLFGVFFLIFPDFSRS